MDISKTFGKEAPPRKGLLPIEILTIIYAALTALLIVVLFGRMDHPAQMLLERAGIVLVTFALTFLYKAWPCKLALLVRVIFQFALLSYWYPDTYEFNRLLPNLDHLFASAEQALFGCQPALLLPQYFDTKWVSEPLNFGYVSYYPLIALVSFLYYFKNYAQLQKVAFIIIGSFFIYYVIYIVLPVTGPQFYFRAIGVDKALAGDFPAVGDYFFSHQEMLATPGFEDGFFYRMVEASQAVGERPTAAFPSSHVGISTIIMILLWKQSKKWFAWMCPVYILLCLATVYIQAHYLIDSIAGFLSSILIYYAVKKLYETCFERCEKALQQTDTV